MSPSYSDRQTKSCKMRNYQLTHWIATQLNLLINNALINLVIKKPKRNHCHMHSAWGKCRPTAFGASSKNQFNKHEFKQKKIEHNRIRVITRFQQPGTRFLNRVISQFTTGVTCFYRAACNAMVKFAFSQVCIISPCMATVHTTPARILTIFPCSICMGRPILGLLFCDTYYISDFKK